MKVDCHHSPCKCRMFRDWMIEHEGAFYCSEQCAQAPNEAPNEATACECRHNGCH